MDAQDCAGAPETARGRAKRAMRLAGAGTLPELELIFTPSVKSSSSGKPFVLCLKGEASSRTEANQTDRLPIMLLSSQNDADTELDPLPLEMLRADMRRAAFLRASVLKL